MGTAFREIARGIGFTEGPLPLPDGKLLVTSMSRGLLYVLDPAVGPDRSVLGEVETGGGPNGLAADPAGCVYVAQNGGRSFPSRSSRPVVPGLQVVDGDAVTDVALPDSVAPNDLVAGPDGAIWFTDPGRAPERGLGPRVRRWVPGTPEVETVAADLDFPNGLAFSADGTQLYVADSQRHEVVRYDVDVDGLHRRDALSTGPGSGPDGIAFDAAGALYVAAFDRDEVVVLEPDGTMHRRLPTGAGSRPTNLCFAGPGLDTLVVTLASGGRVVAAEEVLP